jgi:hypothetical protein
MAQLTDSIQVADHTLLTIRRPNGAIETVRREGGMEPSVFAKIKAATKAAGRGECLGFEVVMRTATVEGYAEGVAAERADDAARQAIYDAMDHAAEKRAGN